MAHHADMQCRLLNQTVLLRFLYANMTERAFELFAKLLLTNDCLAVLLTSISPSNKLKQRWVFFAVASMNWWADKAWSSRF